MSREQVMSSDDSQRASSLEVGGSPQRLRLQSSHKSKKADRSVIRARLVVTDPPDSHSVVYLDSTSFILGRGREADLVLMDDGASREHARFDRDEAGFHITDLDSGNGIFVNGRRIQTTPLYDGDSIAIGRTRIRFETVGWRRVREDGHGFMGSVLGERDSSAADARVRAALIALIVGFLVCFIVGLALRPTAPNHEEQAELILDRTREAMADDRWIEAWSEITSLEVLNLEHPDKDALTDRINLGLASSRIRDVVEQGIEDGVPFTELEKIASSLNVEHPHYEGVRQMIDAQREPYSTAAFKRARHHYRAGHLSDARIAYEEGKHINPGGPVPHALDALLSKDESE